MKPPQPSELQLNDIQLVALHTYDSANPEDLTFQAGDTITFLSRGERAAKITTLIILTSAALLGDDYWSDVRLLSLHAPQLTSTGWRDALMGILVFFQHRL